MVACAETLTAEDKVKGPFAHTDLRAGDSNIPNGTTDSCWFGWQTMEERNPYGGSGSTDTPTKQYVWGTYIDECLQLNLLAVAGPQQLAIGVYYPLQDTLHRAVALTNSGGEIQEAYDTDAYGNTIIFTGPGPDNTWFTDDDTQSSYGASDIIYCGYRYDAETENYYVRNRYYSPTLGRWLTRDPIGYQGGINLYGYVDSSPVGNVDAEGLSEAGDVNDLLRQGIQWIREGDTYAGNMMIAFAYQAFNGNAYDAFQGIYQEILKSSRYHRAAQAHFQALAEKYKKPGTYKLAPMIPPGQTFFQVDFKPFLYQIKYGLNLVRLMDVGDLGIALGDAHFGYRSATLTVTGCPRHLKWRISAEMVERNLYHFHKNSAAMLDPVYRAGYQLQHKYGFGPFYQESTWHESFSGPKPHMPFWLRSILIIAAEP
jgi:RHS repeat-associated protein